METHSIRVRRTARYHVEGELGGETQELWFLLHGYGERARDFLRSCSALQAPGRVLVAPEGLSRFYLRRGNGDVGASWMTKEAREEEIADYVDYLDRLRSELQSSLSPSHTVGVLGFSQGTATAARWALLGERPVNKLILWGGSVPPDADLGSGRERLLELDLTYVLGRADSYIRPEDHEREEERMREAGIAHRTVWFDGGHAIEADVLGELSANR